MDIDQDSVATRKDQTIGGGERERHYHDGVLDGEA
jgi:hypothetical protein